MGHIGFILDLKDFNGQKITYSGQLVNLRGNILDIEFSTYEEVCKELGVRLKAQRLAQMFTQEELAARAGLSIGTVKNIENRGQSSIESVVRLGLELGLADHFQELFNLQVKSIAQRDQVEQSKRIRAPRRIVK